MKEDVSWNKKKQLKQKKTSISYHIERRIKRFICSVDIRVSHITLFFELSLILLTTHAIGTFGKSDRFQTKKKGTSSGQIKILRPIL